MYKKSSDSAVYGRAISVIRLSDGASIPFDPANTDYQAFKRDLANGVGLQDPDGNVMTQDQINSFLETLP